MNRNDRNISERSPFLKGIIALGLGVAASFYSGHKSYEYEKLRESKIPLAFSEIHQIETDAIAQGKVIGENPNEGLIERENESEVGGIARTYYLAGLNDLTMKIFECSNTAHFQDGDFYKQFAKELRLRFDPENKKHHYELTDLFEIVPQSSQIVYGNLQSFIEIEKSLPEIIQAFENSWTEKHHDNYHTEIKVSYDVSTDTNGNTSMTPEYSTEQVYDNTDHSYWYHKEEGEKASFSLDALIDNFPDIKFGEEIIIPSKVNEEGEKAVRESRKLNKDDEELSLEEVKRFVDTWYAGSTLTISELEAYSLWDKVKSYAQEWRGAKKIAQDDFYKTYHPQDNGPKEYQIAEKSKNECSNLQGTLGTAIESVQFTQRSLPELKDKIFEFIETAEKTEEDGDYKKLGKEVLAQTRGLYEKNFIKGFDVDRFRGEMVFLWSFLGLIAGAGIGVGVGAGASALEKRVRGF